MSRFVKIFIFCSFFGICESVLAQHFLQKLPNLPSLGRSTSAWADVNNDGLLDVALIGINSENFKSSGIYRNNGDGTFTNLGIGIPPLSDGSITFFEINNDGNIDLLVTGSGSSNERIIKVYKNKGNGIFTDLNLSFLEGVAYSSSGSGDFDNDGKTDLLVSGLDATGSRITKLYKNIGNDSFEEAQAGITGVSEGKTIISDFNNDRYLDFIISGTNSSNKRVTDLYVNNRKGGFVRKISDLPALREGALSVFDFNNDGYNDIAISGNNDSGDNICKIYKNIDGNFFTHFQDLEAVKNSAMSTGDYNNDGMSDIIISGLDNTDYKTVLYQNNGSSFVKASDPFIQSTNGSLDLVDINNDSKLDIFQTGFSITGPVARIYENQGQIVNTVPLSPLNLTSFSHHDSVVIVWERNSDLETTAKGLSFSYYMGDSPGSSNTISSISDIISGFRRINTEGNIKSNSAVLKNLQEGRYYWSVQAVDGAKAGSPFAPENSIVVCHDFSLGKDTSICNQSTIILNAGDQDDQVKWYTSKNPLIAFSFERNVEVLITEKIKIWAELTKQPLGCTLVDSIIVDVVTPPNVSLGKDTAVCYSEKIQLKTGSSNDRVDWFRYNKELLFANINEIELSIIHDDTIVARVTNIGGCVNYDTIIIASIPLPVVDLGQDQSICNKENLTINLGAKDGFINFFSARKGHIGSGNTLNFQITEEDTIWVSVFNKAGCNSYDTLLVHNLPLPYADAGRDTLICRDEAVRLGANYDGFEDLQFLWYPDLYLDNSRSANPICSVDTTTLYILKITDSKGCLNYDSVLVTIDSKGKIDPGSNTSICYGESIRLGTNPTASGSMLPYYYSWTPEVFLNDPLSPNPIAKPDTTTTFRLVTRTRSCFIDTSYVTITVNPLPVITKIADVTIGLNEVTALNASGGVDYYWYPSEGLSNNEIANPDAFPVVTTTYYVRVLDIYGCESTDSIKVYVKNEVFVPNLFTPNGDGSNDLFKVYGTGIQEMSLKVYNRYGVLVYSSNDVNDIGWDGSFKGKTQDTGAYKWIISGKFFDGTEIKYKEKKTGTINLIR